MANSKQQSRVILIFGDPNQGKTTLASKLHNDYGYYLISLDELYVKFIKARYPKFFLPVLNTVIAQHYNLMFALDPKHIAAWSEHIIAVTKEALKKHRLLAVEGYLLAPPTSKATLNQVRDSLANLATVKTVHASNKQYFVESTIKQMLD